MSRATDSDAGIPGLVHDLGLHHSGKSVFFFVAGAFLLWVRGRVFFLLRVRGRVFFFAAGAGGAFFFLLRVRGRVFFFVAGAVGSRFFFAAGAERFCCFLYILL